MMDDAFEQFQAGMRANLAVSPAVVNLSDLGNIGIGHDLYGKSEQVRRGAVHSLPYSLGETAGRALSQLHEMYGPIHIAPADRTNQRGFDCREADGVLFFYRDDSELDRFMFTETYGWVVCVGKNRA